MRKLLIILTLISTPLISYAEDKYCQPKIKDGSEVRCMSQICTDEFSESQYMGKYALSSGDCISIEKADDNSLLLKADCMGISCKLYRFNKYIYVYGKEPGSPEPVLGTVTFLSDGENVNQIIWQHDARNAFFPRRQ